MHKLSRSKFVNHPTCIAFYFHLSYKINNDCLRLILDHKNVYPMQPTVLPWRSTLLEINRTYAHMGDQIIDLTHLNNSPTSILQNNRNLITRVDTNKGSFVVKDFRGMYFLNRLAYSWFRKTKSIRSYLNSQRLNAMGIRTPVPIAWLDEYAWGILKRSFYISDFYPHPTLAQFIEAKRINQLHVVQSVLNDLAQFALRLHRLGVLHDDFSVGNIFVVPRPEGFDFALIDVNRMRFKKHVSYEAGLSNMKKLQLDPDQLQILVKAYANLCEEDENYALHKFYSFQQRRSKLRRTRKILKRYTIGLIEKLVQVR